MERVNHEFYVSLNVAKLLEKAGFDWGCGKNSIYHSDDGFEDSSEGIYEPTLEVAQRWLREVKNIAVYVCPSYEPVMFVAPNVVAGDEKWIMKWQVAALPYDIEADEIDLGDVEGEMFDTYERALNAGIKKVLEIILEKGK